MSASAVILIAPVFPIASVIPMASVTPHPNYDEPAFDKDVAVMKTAEKINFTEAIQPIPLAPLGRPVRGGSDIVVSGWGRTQVSASAVFIIASVILMASVIPIASVIPMASVIPIAFVIP